MTNISSGLNIRSTNAWKWLVEFQDFNTTSLSHKALLAALGRELHQSVLEVSVFGFELSVLGILKGSADCSILLEPSCHFSNSKLESKIDYLLQDLHRMDWVTSLWLEFDHPYIARPLIYFSLSEKLSKCLERNVFEEFIHVLFSPVSGLLPKTWSEYSYPDCEDITSWLNALPACSIQQFGVSFRDKKVQPRILTSLKENSNVLFTSTNISSILNSPPDEKQYLFAFVWPYSPHQIFGCEILADLCSTCGLRTLRQPPRLMGSNLDRSIKNLLDYEGIDVNRRKVFRRALRSLEHRIYQAVDQIDEPATEVIDISGWNHLKLVFKDKNLANSKLYGGTVRNQFLQRTSPGLQAFVDA